MHRACKKSDELCKHHRTKKQLQNLTNLDTEVVSEKIFLHRQINLLPFTIRLEKLELVSSFERLFRSTRLSLLVKEYSYRGASDVHNTPK